MAIEVDFQIPDSPQALPIPDSPSTTLFILYLSSTDPKTQQPWCSDVRASLPLLNKIFSEEGTPKIHYVYVGQRAEYKSLTNIFRTNWNIQFVPTLARYQCMSNEFKETGRLVEDLLLDEEKVRELISS